MHGLIARLWHGGATLAAPGLRAMLRRRVAWGKEVAARLPEREGIDPTPRPAGLLIWLHAASVGESQSILPVLSAMHEEAPDASVLLTTGTITSAALLGEQLPRLGLDRYTALATLSHDPKIDDPALEAALAAGCFYIGALGSRRTHAARLKRLTESGVPDLSLARIRAPIGLDLGGRAPAEIAVAVLAEAIQALRKGA